MHDAILRSRVDRARWLGRDCLAVEHIEVESWDRHVQQSQLRVNRLMSLM